MAVTYRAADDGVRLPAAVADIRCAAAFAAQATRARSGPRPVVLAGHSSGAHLAAVAALAPREPSPPCRYPAAQIVGLIGLAGPYDLSSFADAAEPLLGAPLAEDPAAWQAAEPPAARQASPGGAPGAAGARLGRPGGACTEHDSDGNRAARRGSRRHGGHAAGRRP